MLGPIGVTGLKLGLSRSSATPVFSVDATFSDAALPAAEIVQHDAHHFTLSALGLAACDVRLDERSLLVRSPVERDRDRVAHFIADNVLPRVAGLEGVSLHAAALAIDDRAFVLIGRSGVGKSTLAARLALEGALLLGDDCAHIKDGLVHPTHRPSRLWPEAAALLGLPASAPDGTGKVSVAETEGVVRATVPVPLSEVLVVDTQSRAVNVSEALDLLLGETLRLIIPSPRMALDQVVELVRSCGPARTIARGTTLAALRAF